MHTAIAYASFSIQFRIFVLSLFHHVMLEYISIPDKVKLSRWYKIQFSCNLTTPLVFDNEVQYTAPSQTVTYSEVTTYNKA